METQKEESGAESIVKEIIAENLPNLGREIGIQIQEDQRT